MFYICHIPNDLEEFVIYDRKAFKPDDFNLEGVKEITIDELKSEYNLLPILKLDEFLIGIMGRSRRTVTRILAECGIETLKAFEYERDLIKTKKSNLSRSQREMVLARYEDIVTCVTEPEEEEVISEEPKESE